MDFKKIYKEYFSFWNTLTNEDKELLLNNSRLMNYKKGTNVHDGSSCTGVFIVNKGSLRIYMISDEGKEVTLYRLFKGDMCMLSASCVLKSITFDVFIDAEEDTECVLLAGSAFSSVAERNDKAKIFALESALSRFSDVMWIIQQILFMSMDKRLAIFLLDESVNEKSDTIALTHEQIAKYMDSAREVVSRMLKYFSNEGIVSVSRKGVKILDKARLRELTL